MTGQWFAEVHPADDGPILEHLERRLLLAASFDLDGDTLIGRGDDTIFSAAWQAEGGYSFSPSPAQPASGPGWDHRADFDGDFAVDSADYAWLSTNWGLSVSDPLRYPDDPHDADERTDEAYAQGA